MSLIVSKARRVLPGAERRAGVLVDAAWVTEGVGGGVAGEDTACMARVLSLVAREVKVHAHGVAVLSCLTVRGGTCKTRIEFQKFVSKPGEYLRHVSLNWLDGCMLSCEWAHGIKV